MALALVYCNDKTTLEPSKVFIKGAAINVFNELLHIVSAVAIGLLVAGVTTAVVAGNLASAPAFLAGAVAFFTPHLAVPLGALGLGTAAAGALSTGLVVGGSVTLLLLAVIVTFMVVDQSLIGVKCAYLAAKAPKQADYQSI